MVKCLISDCRTSETTSTSSPIQPSLDNLLVGVKSITQLSSCEFRCTLCNIKFDFKSKKKAKHHANGVLHKKKVLISTCIPEVEEFLQQLRKKEKADGITNIINQACVSIENEEIRNESSAVREVRANLIG